MGEILLWVYAIRGSSLPSIINIKEAENKVQKENAAAGRNIHLVNMRSYRQRFVALAKTSVETGLFVSLRMLRTWSDNWCRRWTVQASRCCSLGLTIPPPGRGRVVDQAVSCRGCLGSVPVQSIWDPGAGFLRILWLFHVSVNYSNNHNVPYSSLTTATYS